MGTFNQLNTVMKCVRCDTSAYISIEVKFGDTRSMTVLNIGDIYPWIPRKAVQNGGRPQEGSVDGEGYATCSHCDLDFFVKVIIRNDIIHDIQPDSDKIPYMQSSTVISEPKSEELTKALLNDFLVQYDEDTAKKLVLNKNKGVVDTLITELKNTQLLSYPDYREYHKAYKDLTLEDRQDLSERQLAYNFNWTKRYSLAETLGRLGDPIALPELDKLLVDTKELDFWGIGVTMSVAEVAISAIEKIKNKNNRPD
jgi:hypothetical protein